MQFFILALYTQDLFLMLYIIESVLLVGIVIAIAVAVATSPKAKRKRASSRSAKSVPLTEDIDTEVIIENPRRLPGSQKFLNSQALLGADSDWQKLLAEQASRSAKGAPQAARAAGAQPKTQRGAGTQPNAQRGAGTQGAPQSGARGSVALQKNSQEMVALQKSVQRQKNAQKLLELASKTFGKDYALSYVRMYRKGAHGPEDERDDPGSANVIDNFSDEDSGIEVTEMYDEKTGKYLRFRYDFSFSARLIQSTAEQQVRYGRIMDELKAYPELKLAVSWRHLRVFSGKQTLALLLFRRKQLCIAFALPPEQWINAARYRMLDMRGVKRFERTPLLLKLTSHAKTRYACELLRAAAKLNGIVRDPRVETEGGAPFYLQYRSTEQLIDEGFIKLFMSERASAS